MINDLQIKTESAENNKELFEYLNKIVDETKLSDMCIEDSFGRKFKGQFYKEIKNIHRVKKGKRYIIKFDYTGNDIFLIYTMNSIGLTEREVEIIEEEKKIPEKLENEHEFYSYVKYEENKNEIDKVLYILKAINLAEEKIGNLNNSVNEIIDYLKNKGE